MSSHTQASETGAVIACVRARAADGPHHGQPHKEPEFSIILADCCFMQDAPDSELSTILDMLETLLSA